MYLCAVTVNVPDETLGDDLHLERVHPHDQGFQFMDGRFDGFAEVVQRAFADAVNTFIGQDLREQPVLPRITRDVRLDSGYLHRSSRRFG